MSSLCWPLTNSVAPSQNRLLLRLENLVSRSGLSRTPPSSCFVQTLGVLRGGGGSNSEKKPRIFHCRKIPLPPDMGKTTGLIHSLWRLFHSQAWRCLGSFVWEGLLSSRTAAWRSGLTMWRADVASSWNTLAGRQPNPKATPHKI